MSTELAARFDALVTNVLSPLVLGGEIKPERPFGPRLGLALGEGRRIEDPDLRSQLDVARVRIARLIAPVDTVLEISPEDVALTCALNDLLQVSNLDLSGVFSRARHPKLLDSALELTRAVARPRTIAEALSRHTVFARALEVFRTDTIVSWWTGSASFRGKPAPGRLLAWRDFRRVREDTNRIPFVEMSNDVPGVTIDMWSDAAATWLSRSPLTDFATLSRRKPQFRWSDATLSLIATVPGRTLAFRLLSRQRSNEVIAALGRAEGSLVGPLESAVPMAKAFAEEVSAGFAAFGGKATA